MKDLYIKEALKYIPHLLELLDRSPVSPTYGCFDRNYWHYKATDFPAGMYESFVLNLTLVYKHDFPGNIYFNNKRIRQYIEAALHFARVYSHDNGSNDDYYPNESALGSTTFSLYGCSESYLALGLNDPLLEDFFKKRAHFVSNKIESGTLANHHALAALALYNVYLITKDDKYKRASNLKITETLSYQSIEGCFKEYEGCDPGYLTFTIDFLAKYLEKNPEHTRVKEALERAVDFVFWTVHPDGSYAGEYGSRNTYHFLPAGFEILAKHFSKAAYIRNKFIESLKNQTRSHIDDDRIFGHYVYSFIQAYLAHNEHSEAEERTISYIKYFSDAGIYVYSNADTFFICSLFKGGVFKLFKNGHLIASDCGLVITTTTDQISVSQVWNAKRYISVSEDATLVIRGTFYKNSSVLPSPWRQLAFRLFTLTFGKYFSRATRVILQKILILSKKEVPVRFERVITLKGSPIKISDTIIHSLAEPIKHLYIPSDFSAIYVASSKPFQSSNLLLWQDHSDKVNELNTNHQITIERVLGYGFY